MEISHTVNGEPHTTEVDGGALLVDHLRDDLGLTGAKVGCDTGQCGACVVRMNGRSVKSCLVLVAQTDGAEIETIEAGTELSPLQEAMVAEHATQCGFCTPGMVMALADLLEHEDDDPSEQQIRAWLTGNLCRCTGYHSVVRSVQRTAGSGKGAAT
ncbi:MAG TPA: (2Fe-2S)-binding protein [Pseudonocardiaceae bacterium]|nr:(2Fe-2S)-binding protein [Pseudonocardiaceae bacterium]